MGFKIPTFSQATRTVTPRKAEGQVTEANRVAQQQAAVAAAQAAEYNRRLQEQAQKIREMQESAERTQLMRGPEPQQIGPAATATEDQRKRKMGSSRGSLLAGNTGGYNPATGGGRLGGMMRSLLG